MFLLPQLPKFAADDMACQLGRLSIGDARSTRALDHPLKVYSPTGGSQLSDAMLQSLRDSVEDIARASGYPRLRSPDVSSFDLHVAGRLQHILRISPNEAAKPGPWMFLACVVMPDIVLWRQRRAEMAVVNSDNFLDTTNNLFRRLWWRAAIFTDDERGADPLWLLEHLLEDAVQTFYERRSLSGVPQMGVVFGRIYHAAASLLPPGFNMEPVERTVQKWLVRVGENVAYDYLCESDLIAIMAEAFHASVPQDHAATVSVERLIVAVHPAPKHAPSPDTMATLVPQEPAVAAMANAFEFDERHRLFFKAEAGTYSKVTHREADASEVNLTGPEARLAEQFFGRDRIHAGAVRADPAAATQRFRAYPGGELVYLNLVYPKRDRTEMRLYLSSQKGFKPSGGSIWFLFQRGRDLFVGFMPGDEWNKLFNYTAQ
jgi:hypothetical protein